MEVDWGGIYMYDPPKQSSSAQSALVVTSGSEQCGWRPWVIVSRDGVHRGKRTAIGVPLTTRVDKANSYRIAIPLAHIIPEGPSSYQFRDSVALCDHVRVLDLTIIKLKIGRLSDVAIISVGNGLANVLDIR
jgi:mRNA-degrading endonuclease toxin of MazEF toxin-antitoxin module